jgi:hypothetical protein
VAGALKHFKASVDAWSNAAYRQPRTVVKTTQRTFRLAAGWALGCLLAAGSLAGAVYERGQRQEAARIAARKAAEQITALKPKAAIQPVTATVATRRQPATAKRAANENEDLLATVDSDVSRQVPAAMEPLAQMMESSGSN